MHVGNCWARWSCRHCRVSLAERRFVELRYCLSSGREGLLFGTTLGSHLDLTFLVRYNISVTAPLEFTNTDVAFNFERRNNTYVQSDDPIWIYFVLTVSVITIFVLDSQRVSHYFAEPIAIRKSPVFYQLRKRDNSSVDDTTGVCLQRCCP